MDTQNLEKEYGFGLIMEHLAGSPSDDSQKQLADWRHASDENEQLFVWMQQMWRSLSLSDRDKTFDKQRAYRLFLQRVGEIGKTGEMGKIGEVGEIGDSRLRGNDNGDQAGNNDLRASQLSTLNSQLSTFLKYAAILVPWVVLGYLSYRYFTTEPEPIKTPLLSDITVPAGSKIQMSLQDGTKVWLNADSYLRYDSDFGITNRTITLLGEAYFEVAKDEKSPFIVNVGGIKVKVHGTHFNVNAYKENNGVAVTLLEGSVEMITAKSQTMLTPGNMARYNATTGKIAVTAKTEKLPADAVTQNQNVKRQKDVVANTTVDAIDWINNRLVFNGESFEQIIATLERSYNVKVNIHNEQIKKRRFAGDFTNNETIEQILTVMAVNGKFRYGIKGNIIDIY